MSFGDMIGTMMGTAVKNREHKIQRSNLRDALDTQRLLADMDLGRARLAQDNVNSQRQYDATTRGQDIGQMNNGAHVAAQLYGIDKQFDSSSMDRGLRTAMFANQLLQAQDKRAVDNDEFFKSNSGLEGQSAQRFVDWLRANHGGDPEKNIPGYGSWSVAERMARMPKLRDEFAVSENTRANRISGPDTLMKFVPKSEHQMDWGDAGNQKVFGTDITIPQMLFANDQNDVTLGEVLANKAGRFTGLTDPKMIVEGTNDVKVRKGDYTSAPGVYGKADRRETLRKAQDELLKVGR